MLVLNLFGQSFAKSLVFLLCVYEQHHEYYKLKEQVKPQMSDNHCKAQCYGTRIECEDIGVLHERQASFAELLA
jgi:hypothetical protein